MAAVLLKHSMERWSVHLHSNSLALEGLIRLYLCEVKVQGLKLQALLLPLDTMC